MERVIFENVWKMYDRRYGSNRFRRMLSSILGRHPEAHEFWALQNVSFRLEEGKSLGIIGPNGSGKTTILRILSGISYINRGHVLVRGSISALIALGAGFHPELSGRENIYLNGSILGLRHNQIRKYFDDIVDFAGIGKYIDSPVKRYSSGMFVRLGFAVAAQMRPDLLLVDEVLAVGDAQFQARCHERIRELRNQGAIIILVSHDLWAIRQSCQEGIFLQQGQVQASGEISEVIAAYNKAIQEQALAQMALKHQTDEEFTHASCEIEFLDSSGKSVSEVTLGKKLVIRLRYQCNAPIPTPTLIVAATAHNGPCSMVLRSRKEGWNVERLEGLGYVDVEVENLRLNPGRYAIQLAIKDRDDLTIFAKSPFRDLLVSTPDPDWCYEDCHYVPDALWKRPVVE